MHVLHLTVTRQYFHDLAQTLLSRYPIIQAVEWAPRVQSADRTAFETAQQSDLPGFAIRQRAASGELQPATDRRQFYPVTYIEPLAGNEQAVGFDIASNATRLAAIESAISSGKVTATAPIRLVQERAEQTGILLIRSVPSGPTGPGIVLVVLRMGTLAKALTDPLASTLGLKLADAAAGQPFFNEIPASEAAAYETSFDFGNRRYLVQTAPSGNYLAQHRGWQSWAVLASGILGTGLLGALLMLGTGHAFQVERLAEKSRESKSRLSAILEQIPFGVGLLDLAGGWIFTNSTMRRFAPAVIPSRDTERMAQWRAVAADNNQPLKPDQWPSARALRGEVVSPGIDFRYTDDEGHEISNCVAAAPFLKADGAIGGAIAVVQDLTPLKQAEQTRQQLATIVQASRDAIWSWAIDGSITTWNAEAERMLGYTAKKWSASRC